jgi:ubiquitin
MPIFIKMSTGKAINLKDNVKAKIQDKEGIPSN